MKMINIQAILGIPKTRIFIVITICFMRFQVLMAESMTVFWIVVPYSLVEVYQFFRGACCLNHQGDHPDDGSTSETLVNFYQASWSNIPEDGHLQLCHISETLPSICSFKGRQGVWGQMTHVTSKLNSECQTYLQ
jgi:hypothetical protein